MGKFSRDISKFVKKSKEATVDVPRKVAIDLFSAIVRDTPVLTGRARANWQVSEGDGKTGIVEAADPTGEGATAAIVETARNLDPDATIVLRNNLPYIYPLEYEGQSKKAPEGMVRRNVARFKAVTEKVVKEVT